MTPPNDPRSPRVCANPDCDEIVRPPEDGSEFPLYHSRECRMRARKMRRVAREQATAADRADGPASDQEADGEASADRRPEPEPEPPTMSAGPAWSAAEQASTAIESVPPPPELASLRPEPAAPLPQLATPPIESAATSSAPASSPDTRPASARRVPRRWRSSGGPWALAVAASFLAFVAIGGVLVVLRPPHHALPPTGLRLQPTSPAPAISTHAPAIPHRRRPRRPYHPSSPVTAPVANTPPAPAPSASPTPAPSRTAPPRPRHFAALAGAGCPQSARSGTERTRGWYVQSAGGWAGDGCSGAYVSKWVHQSGTAPVRTFGWWFVARTLRRATCQVSVYVPAGSATTVGANPAPYTVYTGSPWRVAGTFRIDQRNDHRRWVFAGVFPARDGQLSVEVQNIGDGSAEVAADALAVSCTSR